MSLQTIFDQSVSGRRGTRFATVEHDRDLEQIVPAACRRKTPPRLPEVSELDVVRHYTNLSRLNVGVDTTFYPLGSCTMKYNPRENEQIVAMPQFAELHPLQPTGDVQGMLGALFELQQMLCTITGMQACSLTPSAGAQGEFTGVRMMAAYHQANGDDQRDVLLVPDSAHGTNPASATMCGYDPVEVPSKDGRVDLAALEPYLNERLAGIMLTNPNTLGLFERDILEISRRIHDAGGLLYYDGANLNAIVGKFRPGDMGFDIVHLNTHKTFSTPHGGGGPGCGPVTVTAALAPFLPLPRIERDGDAYVVNEDAPQSIGRLHGFAGNLGVALRALVYIRRHGADALRAVAEHSVLNANYLKTILGELYTDPYPGRCMHEFTISLRKAFKEHGITAFDVAKRLLDYGFYAPTVYFPLLVKEGMLIEPTETESQETLDRFIAALQAIRNEIDTNPDSLHDAPRTTPVRRLDDTLAARKPVLGYYEEPDPS